MIRERVNLWNAVWIQAASNLAGCGVLQDTKSFLSSLQTTVVASFPCRVLEKQVCSLTLFEPLRQYLCNCIIITQEVENLTIRT